MRNYFNMNIVWAKYNKTIRQIAKWFYYYL